jgi:hypothetical protein
VDSEDLGQSVVFSSGFINGFKGLDRVRDGQRLTLSYSCITELDKNCRSRKTNVSHAFELQPDHETFPRRWTEPNWKFSLCDPFSIPCSTGVRNNGKWRGETIIRVPYVANIEFMLVVNLQKFDGCNLGSVKFSEVRLLASIRGSQTVSTRWRPERLDTVNADLSAEYEVTIRRMFLSYHFVGDIWWTTYPIMRCGIEVVCKITTRLTQKRYPRNRPWSPIGLWDAMDLTLSRQSDHRWWQGCQPYAPAALYSLETLLFFYFSYSFLFYVKHL